MSAGRDGDGLCFAIFGAQMLLSGSDVYVMDLPRLQRVLEAFTAQNQLQARVKPVAVPEDVIGTYLVSGRRLGSARLARGLTGLVLDMG